LVKRVSSVRVLKWSATSVIWAQLLVHSVSSTTSRRGNDVGKTIPVPSWLPGMRTVVAPPLAGTRRSPNPNPTKRMSSFGNQAPPGTVMFEESARAIGGAAADGDFVEPPAREIPHPLPIG